MVTSNSFADRVADWLDEGEIVREGLAYEGPRLVARLTLRMSLRKLARRAELSPTYLSLVANEKAVISPHAFITLSNLEQQ